MFQIFPKTIFGYPATARCVSSLSPYSPKTTYERHVGGVLTRIVCNSSSKQAMIVQSNLEPVFVQGPQYQTLQEIMNGACVHKKMDEWVSSLERSFLSVDGSRCPVPVRQVLPRISHVISLDVDRGSVEFAD